MSPEPGFQPLPPEEPTTSRLLTRRRVLGLIGIAGAGLAAVPAADALRPFLSRMVAEKWPRRLKPLSSSSVSAFTLIDTENYGAFLKSQKLRHVTIAKILASHAKERNGVRNALPPTSLWMHLLPTLRVAEALAERLQEDVKVVVSAYRTPGYNAMCPGSAKNSQHLQNNALDLVFKSAPVRVAEAARELRSKGLFKGGVGLYAGFTHVDTRGHNSDW